MIKDLVALKAAFDSYAATALTFNVSPPQYKVLYAGLKLAGEAGEVAEKLGKILRDHGGKISDQDRLEIAKEMGDVLWYLALLASDLNIPFHQIPLVNIAKLEDRRDRGVIQGSGDNR